MLISYLPCLCIGEDIPDSGSPLILFFFCQNRPKGDGFLDFRDDFITYPEGIVPSLKISYHSLHFHLSTG